MMRKNLLKRTNGKAASGRTARIYRKVLIRGAVLVLSLGLGLAAPAWAQQGGQAWPGDQAGRGGVPGAQGGMPPGMSPGGNMGPNANVNYIPAIYIGNGAYQKEKSHPEAVSGGTVGDTTASGVTISSTTNEFNGIYVGGSQSDYTLSNAVITLSGNGINHMDNYGSGAAAVAGDGATLTLRHVDITTNGLVSCAAVSTGGSILKVYDSTLTAHGGIVPPGTPPLGSGPEAYGPPAALGITSGTARACNTTNNAKSYYYNSTIIADGWGALSTDESGKNGVYLEANNCDVKVIQSGYGTYADGGCRVVINKSKFNVATYGGIAAGSGNITFNDTDVISGGNCAMLHNIGAVSEITGFRINGGRIETKDAVILVKSANADITVDGAQLVSGSGVLIKSIINDDANAAKVNGQKVPGIKVVLKKMALSGNILHEDGERTMSVTLEGTTLKGAIKNASLSLGSGSSWSATADSTVTLFGSVDVSSIDASKGVSVTATCGPGCMLNGTYHLASGGVLYAVAK